MIYRYEIMIKGTYPIYVSTSIPKRTDFQKLHIQWVQDQKRKLIKVCMDIIGKQFSYDRGEDISPYYPDVEAKAFNAAYLIANSIFIQTGIQPFDPQNILTASPEMIAETKDEEFALSKNSKPAFSGCNGKLTIINKFDPTVCLDYYNISIAIAHFANGHREQVPTIKFEQYYKVVESLFEKSSSKNANDFDNRVSEHVIPINNQFTPDLLKELRRIRNRCTHPNANLGHLNPNNIIAIREVKEYLKTIQKLAKILINNPPS